MLFSNLRQALDVLRHGKVVVTDAFDLQDTLALRFFSLLEDLESFVESYNEKRLEFAWQPKIAVIEGLDGTGKTTLAKGLAQRLQEHRALNYRTPPESMKQFRATFDKIGGPIERAFYMVYG